MLSVDARNEGGRHVSAQGAFPPGIFVIPNHMSGQDRISQESRGGRIDHSWPDHTLETEHVFVSDAALIVAAVS